VLTVPNDAIHRENPKRPYVYVVRAGKAHETVVGLGTSNDTVTIVKRGLSAGDVVVAERNDALKDGTAVRPQASPSPAASS